MVRLLTFSLCCYVLSAPILQAKEVERALQGLALLAPFWQNSVQQPPIVEELNPLLLEYRLAELDRTSPIPMRYHPRVAHYIEIFTQKRRPQFEQMLGLSKLYFPLYRAVLDQHQMPLELVYLSVIESALNPLAISPTGAVGLWQFKLPTAEMMGLYVDSYVDDRMDPLLATQAACVYLQYLYKTFGDWLLALTAYNIGPGALQRIIARADGERDYWKLWPILPEAAQNYVPSFIAAAYTFRYAKEYQLTAHAPLVQFDKLDTLHISKPLSFRKISQWTGTPLELIHLLNPKFRQGYLPKPEKQPHQLVLPQEDALRFAQHQKRIYAQSFQKEESHFQLADDKTIKLRHTVKKGEYLHKIALFYGCTAEELQRWNKIHGNIYPGLSLLVWVSPTQYGHLVQQRLISPVE